MQVAPAHARSLHGHDDVARAGRWVRELPKFELALNQKHNAAHLALRQETGYIEKSSAFSVMNSRSAGTPSCVFTMARLMAGTISEGSVTRSPWPPNARAIAA